MKILDRKSSRLTRILDVEEVQILQIGSDHVKGVIITGIIEKGAEVIDIDGQRARMVAVKAIEASDVDVYCAKNAAVVR